MSNLLKHFLSANELRNVYTDTHAYNGFRRPTQEKA